ncbi:MAG: S8 family serine peptidase [Bacteroidota bacterium]
MAAGANLYVLDYEATFLDTTLSLHIDENVLVTNSSYSNGCNVGYTEITATVDQQMNEYPTFLHVFSAGNSNNNDCDYGAGNQWGNITGGHKQGKNVIATANVFSDGSLVESSSRGPAHDGRIKPDIAANGQEQFSTDPNNLYEPFGGTSGAAPGIAGITAQLHEAYQELNGGATADAALLKAVLLNSANDAGNVGPDFKFGWGIVNSFRAALTLEENRYFTGSVEPGQTQSHSIEVPAGVNQVKIMTYWRERESAVMVTKALINDLDTRVVAPTAAIHMPWLLDPTPDPALLDAPANKGVDDLNNVEQVAIDNPVMGTYTLEVTGTELPFGAHDYFVVYEFITDQHTITYPVGGEGFVPGEVERIHWDADGDGGNFIIVYSLDGGNSWLLVENISGDRRMYEWTVPEELSGQARIMIVRGPITSMSEDFSISSQPQNLAVTEVCPDYIRLGWDPVNNVNEYELMMLGERYMESIGTATTNSFDFPITDPNQSYWFAVKAIGENNLASRRTEAIFYEGGLLDCMLQNDMSLDDVLVPNAELAFSCNGSFEESITVQITNHGAVEQDNITIGLQLDDNLPIEEVLGMSLAPGGSTDFTFSSPLSTSEIGGHIIRTWVSVADDAYALNDSSEIALTVVAGTGVLNPFSEDFESGVFPPADWQSVNPDAATGWESFTTVQASGEMGTVMRMNNYVYASAELSPQEDYMYTMPIDLTGAPNDVGLSFDLAYSGFGSFSNPLDDALRVELSSDCGQSFSTVIYDKAGDELETLAGGASFPEFFPESGADWRNEVIDLQAYIGSTIVLRFVSVSSFGNNLYIDNLNVAGLSPQAVITVEADEICRGLPQTITSVSQGGSLDYFWDFGQGAFPPSSTLQGPHQINYATTGEVVVSLLVTNSIGTSTASYTFNVIDVPEPDFTASPNGTEVSFSNTSTWGNTYSWNFGDGNTSDEENPIHTYDTEGLYTVTLEVSNACGTSSVDMEVSVIISSTNNPNVAFDMALAPNPNRGDFNLILESTAIEQLEWGVFTLQGQEFRSGQIQSTIGTSHHRIELNDIAAGIYLMKVRSEDGTKTIKLVVM